MTNEELMQLMTELGLHEGGIENWVHDNAWLVVVNKAIELERESCAKLMDAMAAQDRATNYYKVAANAIRARSNE